ncbi:MAG: hypothetical protein GY787_23550, partial [Alteromonadales bacterium]|nr:hypothetical protein [Alteromonadales bacterium]
MDTKLNFDQLEESVIKLLREKQYISFLLIGRTGVGKSSTINSLLGQDVATTSKYRPATMGIKTYQHCHEQVNYKIIDTPGLCDDLPEAGNDDRYLYHIRKCAAHADCIWFVTELDAPRMSSDEKRSIKLISQALGECIWSRSIIVFTRSDKVNKKDFDSDVTHRTAVIRKEILKYASTTNVNDIPCVAVSNLNETLPNNKPWLGDLFTQVVARCSDSAALPFLLSMQKDVEEESFIKKSQPRLPDKIVKPKRIIINPGQKEKIKDAVVKRVVSSATSGA